MQPHGGLHTFFAGQGGEFHCLGGVASQRPLGEDVLACLYSRLGWLVVRRHPDHHGHGIDLRRGGQLPEIVERELRSEGLAGLLGALGARGADGGELDVRAGQQRREVGLSGPGRVNVRPHKAEADLFWHA